jgi:hypothetical protein
MANPFIKRINSMTSIIQLMNFLNEMARAIVLTSCEETVKYPQ